MITTTDNDKDWMAVAQADSADRSAPSDGAFWFAGTVTVTDVFPSGTELLLPESIPVRIGWIVRHGEQSQRIVEAYDGSALIGTSLLVPSRHGTSQIDQIDVYIPNVRVYATLPVCGYASRPILRTVPLSVSVPAAAMGESCR